MKKYFQYIHSSWHVIIATSLIFLLPPKKGEDSLTSERSTTIRNSKESSDESSVDVEEIQPNNHLIADIS